MSGDDDRFLPRREQPLPTGSATKRFCAPRTLVANDAAGDALPPPSRSVNSILGGEIMMRESGKLIDRMGESEPVTAGIRV